MSTQSNIVEKQRAAYHGAGPNSADVQTAVNGFTDIVEYVRVGTNEATPVNGYSIVCPTVNCRLKEAHYIGGALTSAAGDDAIITVTTNGISAVSWNTNSSAQANIAANALTDLNPTTTNAFVDTDEHCVVSYTMADTTNNAINGVIRLVFERV